MPKKFLFSRLFSQTSLSTLALIFLICRSFFIFATCNCPIPDPALCPQQPTGPPYQPCTLIDSANSYVLRYSVNGERGSMTFIGNTLGLSKAPCLNEPGTAGNVVSCIGAFTTVDPAEVVGSYVNIPSGTGGPAGTTIDWTQNNSSAVLSLPPGVLILYAELIWSGSFGYYCSDPTTGPGTGVDPSCILDAANGPITFVTPDGITHFVTADPTTAMLSQNPAPDVQDFYCAGNYTRSQNVTPLVAFLSNINGTYTVGRVPGTISALDNDHNAAGWTLAIIYHDPSSPLVNNMTLFLGAQQGSRAPFVQPAEVTGFCAQTTPGLQSARLLVSAIEGDADLQGDHMQFGPTPTSLTNVFGPNNPVDNFFCSQINDDTGQLISTTGTYCPYNSDPITGTLVPNGRQGYDITNVDCSSLITSGQMTAYALGSTVGDDYMINAIGIQISVVAPVIVPIKLVNGVLSVNSNVGEILSFSVRMENTGALAAENVIFQDTLQAGLALVPGSLTMNGVPVPAADPLAGIPIGTINIGDTVLIEFQVEIVSPPVSGNTFFNFGNVSFDYSACTALIHTTNDSTLVMVVLPTDPLPSAGDFTGTVKKCKFLNKAMYTLKATWTESPVSTALSYQIFRKGKLKQTISATDPLVFETCLNSKKEANEYTLVTLYPNGLQSAPENIRIIRE